MVISLFFASNGFMFVHYLFHSSTLVYTTYLLYLSTTDRYTNYTNSGASLYGQLKNRLPAYPVYLVHFFFSSLFLKHCGFCLNHNLPNLLPTPLIVISLFLFWRQSSGQLVLFILFNTYLLADKSNPTHLIVLFEIYFYFSIFFLFFSENYGFLGSTSFFRSSLLLPMFFFNFIGSWFILILVLSLFSLYSCDSLTFTHFSPYLFPTLLSLILVSKLNFGPWFFRNFPIYSYISINYYFYYTVLYFVLVIPTLNSVYINNDPYLMFLVLILSVFYYYKDSLKIDSLRSLLLASSFINYCYLFLLSMSVVV